MSASDVSAVDTDILARVIDPERGDFPADLARAMLKLDFPPADRTRMQALLEKSQAGELTDSEQGELDSFVRVGQFLGMIKSKARVSLRNLGA